MSDPVLLDESVNTCVRRYIDAWHQHDAEAVVSLHTPDTFFTSSATALAARGHEELRKALNDLFRTWPDLQFTPQRIYGDGRVLFVESIISVTQARPMILGDVEIEPTGRKVQTTVVDLIDVRDGLVANKHSYLDELGYLRAMGHAVVPCET